MAIEIRIGTSFNDRDIRRAQAELRNLASVAEKSSQSVVSRMEQTGKQFQSIGRELSTKVTLPLVAAGGLAVKFAADLEDSMGASEQIFGSAAGSVQKWAKDLPSYFGIAERSALTHVNIMGSMLQNIGGLAEDEAAKQGQALLELAGDLTAMYGGTVEDAVRALTGALKGNNSMLDNYGMGVNDATIKAKALEMGLTDGTSALSLQAKQAATLALIWEQTGSAQGQAAREAGTASGQMRSLKTDVENLATEIGSQLLPFVSAAAGIFRTLTGFMSSLPGPIKSVIVAFGGIAAAVGPVIWVTGTLMTNLAAIAKSRVGIALIDGFVSLRTTLQTAASQGGIMNGVMGALGNTMGRLQGLLLRGGALVGGFVLLATVIRNAAGAAADAKLGTFAQDVDRVRAAMIDFNKGGRTNQAVISMDDFREAAMAVRVELFKSDNANRQPPIIKQIEQLKYHFDGTYESADKARDRLKNFDEALMAMDFSEAQAFLSEYFKTMGWGAVTAESTADILPQFSGRLKDSTQIVDPAARAVLGLGEAYDGVGGEIDDAAGALDRWQSAVKAQFDPLWGWQESVRETIELKTEEAKKQAEVNAIVAQFGPDSEEARRAMAELDQIQQNQIVSAGTQRAKWTDLVAGIKSGEVPILKAISDIDKLAEEGLISAQAARDQKTELQNLASFLLATMWPTVEIPINSNAAEVLSTLLELERVFKRQQAEIERQGLTDWVLGMGNEPRAAGGPVQGGMAGWVGERGPELFVPKVDGTIVPHYQSRRIMDELGRGEAAPASSGGATFNITVNGMVGRDKREILEFLARELPKQAALTGRAFG